MKSIAVLLTVFNRKDKTLQSLERLYKLLPLDDIQVDVYLTDDGCTDGTPEALTEYFPQVNTRIQQASAKLRNVFVKALLWC